MSLATETEDIDGIVNRLLDNMSLSIASVGRQEGSSARRQIGIVRADFLTLLRDRGFGTELLSCFTLLLAIPVTLDSISYVRDQLFLELPEGPIASALVQTAIFYCLSSEGRILSKATFVSRDEVEVMMARMKAAFDRARDIASDDMDSQAYLNLTRLAGAVTQHLATTARPLPRMVTFKVSHSYPAMPLANLLYHDPKRWEELVAENNIHHPAFMPRVLRGLSA